MQSSPAATVARQRDWLRNLRQVMAGAIRHDLAHRARGIEIARSQLLQRSPAIAVQQSIRRLDGLQQRLGIAGTACVTRLQHKLSLAVRSLDSVSPLATLERGYSIVSDAKSGIILTDSSQVVAGASIRARLRHGQVEATVTGTSDGDTHED